jgi:hypothetical protein
MYGWDVRRDLDREDERPDREDERRVCKDGCGQKSWVHESVSSTRWGMLQAGLSTIVLV